MIRVIHTELSHIVATIAGLALLLVLAGWSYHRYQIEQQTADVIRNWNEVTVLEARLDRYEQVVDFYTRVKPIPLPEEIAHD